MNKSHFTCLLLSLALTPTLRAADGQIDLRIDPATGATVDQPGSYVVVENVIMTADAPAITVTANNVIIDLAGHILNGFEGGTSDGISAVGIDRLRISNGVIQSFGGDGIETQDNARIEKITVSGCAGWGMRVRSKGTISHCEAEGNNSAGSAGGILGLDQCAVTDCVVSGNSPVGSGAAYGIRLNDNARVERNRIFGHATSDSLLAGIYAQSYAVILDNQVRDLTGGQTGIPSTQALRCTTGSVVMRNSVSYCSGYGSTTGITGGDYSVIEANSVTSLTALGGNPLIAISVSGGSVIRGNTANYNFHDGTGFCYGISAGANCTVVNNTATFNREAFNGANTVVGINVGSGCLVMGNSSGSNLPGGTDGSTRGIKTGSGCMVRDNTCDGNDALGTGNAAGIEVSSSCRVLDNHCNGSSGGTTGYGIRVTGNSNHVAGNNCSGNSTAGLLFGVATNNRSESNRFRQTVGIDTTNGATPSSQGAGTLADLTY